MLSTQISAAIAVVEVHDTLTPQSKPNARKFVAEPSMNEDSSILNEQRPSLCQVLFTCARSKRTDPSAHRCESAPRDRLFLKQGMHASGRDHSQEKEGVTATKSEISKEDNKVLEFMHRRRHID